MTTTAIVAIVTLCISILAIVVKIAWTQAELAIKVNTLWEVFINQPPNAPRRGRRHTDRSTLAFAHDRDIPKPPAGD